MYKSCLNPTCNKRFSVRVVNNEFGFQNAHRKYCYDCDGVMVWENANLDRGIFLRKRWERLNPERAKARYRRHRLKKYGLTVEKFEAELKKHKNRCAICKRCFNGRWNKPNIDHKHNEKGTFRGLVCVNCNLVIGFSQESEKILLATIKYLRKFSK